jgi:RNA polymerase I-specific transcription initiation factor RRN3
MVSLVPVMRPSTASTSSKTLKPLLRRSTLSGTVRKVDDTDFDSDLTSHASSPTKRARVTFEDDVEEKTKRARVTFKDDVEEKIMVQYAAKGRGIDVIRAEVRRALEDHARGESTAYDVLKQVFSRRKEDDDDDDDEEEEESQKRAEIRTYVMALTNYASQLNKSCSGLVQAVIGCDWLGRDESFVKSYVQFLGSLSSSQGSYVGTVLEMLVTTFYGGGLPCVLLRFIAGNSLLISCSSIF